MQTLNIDIETYSETDIKNGVYKYVDDPSFEILIFAYSVDKGEVQVIDLAQGEQVPQEIVEALSDDTIKKAFNAQFERVCLNKWFGLEEDASNWRCTMIHATELGLPRSLERCAAYLNLSEQKDNAGKNLIRYFSVPCKPTKVNGGRTRNLPEHDPEGWQNFVEYCKQDVRTEMAIDEKLQRYPIHPLEWSYYTVDQKINDLGVEVDWDLVEGALALADDEQVKNHERMKTLTGLENPNSTKQLLEWLQANGSSLDNLRKKSVEDAIPREPEKVQEVLRLRLEASLASIKKYDAIERVVCSDGRVHGLLQFYGASRTGRWSGRLVQVQNLAQNHIEELDLARDLVKQWDGELLTALFDSVNDTLKQLIRTAFIAKEGHTFFVNDFSAIEARVLAWFAGEKWRLETFAENGDIYKASIAQMLNLDIKSVDKNLRQKGKVAELALGYQGGPGAMKAMGALDMGLDEKELPDLVTSWRKASPRIVKFWRDVEDSAVEAVAKKGVSRLGNLTFFYRGGFLFIQLPSGRNIAYPKPRLVEGKFGSTQIEYEGQGMKAGFSKLDAYGGKLVENIVQATARDILAEAMRRLDNAGYKLVFSVHDELVAEVPDDTVALEEMTAIMTKIPEWAEGLPLNSDGYTTKYYKKD